MTYRPVNRYRRARARRLWILCVSGIFTLLVCVLRSFVLPHTPILSWGDGLGYATKGERLAQGELPYRDFFEFASTGTDLVYAALFHLLGVSLWVPIILMCLVATAAAICLTWIAGRMLPRPLVALPALLFTGFVLWGSLDPTHHWFSTLAALGAVVALFDGITSRRTFCRGSPVRRGGDIHPEQRRCCALRTAGISLVQLAPERTAAPLETIAAAMRRCIASLRDNEWPISLLRLVFIDGLPMSLCFLCAILDPSRPTTCAAPFPTSLIRRDCCGGSSFPFSISLFPWRMRRPWHGSCGVVGRRERRKQSAMRKWNRPLLLAIVGLSLLVAVASAPSIRRLSCASPLAMILLVWLLSSSGRRGQLVAKSLGALSVAIACALIVGVHLHRFYPMKLPAGKVAVYDADIAKVYSSMAQRTKPGQWFFGLPSLTLPLELRNPTPIEAPAPGDYTRPRANRGGHSRTGTNEDSSAFASAIDVYVPHLLGYRADHLQPFQDYLYAHYRRTSVFRTGDEVWERIGR